MQTEYRKQKYLTVSPEQEQLIKANAGKMTINELSILLGLPFQKTYNNLKLLQLTKRKATRKPPPPKYKIIEDKECRIIDFDRNGYFDEAKFAKYYQY
ncbi:MAG: hypothetical protein V4538_15055 [Bacteroidota bacterium]